MCSCLGDLVGTTFVCGGRVRSDVSGQNRGYYGELTLMCIRDSDAEVENV